MPHSRSKKTAVLGIASLWSALALITGCEALFSGTPAAGWSRHAIDDLRKGADGVKLGDVNRDGLIDLVASWEQSGAVVVYLNPGSAAVKTSWPSVVVGRVGSVEDAVFVDLDGDGRLDVVSCCEGDVKTMYVHWGPPDAADLLDPTRWQTEAIPVTRGARQWMFCEPAEIDGRDGVDLVAGAKGAAGAIGLLLSPPEPRRLDDWRWVKLADAAWIMSIIPYDVDGDGDLDVLYTDRKGAERGCYWLENPGGVAAALGLWLRHRIGTSSDELMFMDVGDLDHDDLLDVVVATDARRLLHFSPLVDPRLPWLAQSIPWTDAFGTGKAVRIADLDGDGVNDLAFSCENAGGSAGVGRLSRGEPLAWLWSARFISGKQGKKFDLLQILDLDGDGDLDVVTTEESDGLGVIWYENPTIP